MGKLHEVLAVDRDLENAAKKIMEEAVVTFTKKTEHFLGSHKTLNMFDDDRRQEEAGQEEIRALTTTVPDKLDYVSEFLIRHIDCLAQKEKTNQDAKGTVEIDTQPFLQDIPATLLLAIENKLALWRKVYETIPTLAPHITWEKDEQQGKNVYKAKDDIIKHKTEKTIKPVVLYEATDKHPAQIEKISVDVPVGDYVTVQWSGMISAARKSELLGRIDALMAEVKKARMRANNIDVIDIQVGKKIFDYINA